MILRSKNFSFNEKVITFVGFTICMLISTGISIKGINNDFRTKLRDNYEFDDADVRFETLKDILQLTILCFIAAILCGLTGIAGGMVLAPLFLAYGIVPQIAVSTN